MLCVVLGCALFNLFCNVHKFSNCHSMVLFQLYSAIRKREQSLPIWKVSGLCSEDCVLNLLG